MFSDRIIRIIITVTLLGHAVAHAIALVALVVRSLRGPSASGVELQSWLLSSLSQRTLAAVAIPFWLVSTVGFVLAVMSFWGILVPGGAWRQLAVASAIVSLLGIALLAGVWPGSPSLARAYFNTFWALSMNTAILVTQLWPHWPPQAMFGK